MKNQGFLQILELAELKKNKNKKKKILPHFLSTLASLLLVCVFFNHGSFDCFRLFCAHCCRFRYCLGSIHPCSPTCLLRKDDMHHQHGGWRLSWYVLLFHIICFDPLITCCYVHIMSESFGLLPRFRSEKQGFTDRLSDFLIFFSSFSTCYILFLLCSHFLERLPQRILSYGYDLVEHSRYQHHPQQYGAYKSSFRDPLGIEQVSKFFPCFLQDSPFFMPII
jgi:hypothetical protein